MRAMILAAGRGERMRPLTDNTPKPLLQAGGKPLIVWHIERLVAAGITQLVINHAWLGSQIEAALGSGAALGARITYSAETGQALETAGGIANALQLLGPEPFLVINGDVWCNWNPAHAPALAHQMQEQQCRAWLLLVPNPAHNPHGDFHLLESGKVLASAPADSPRYTFSGIGIYQASLFDTICPGERAPLAPLLRTAMNDGAVLGQVFSGDWVDVGTPQRLALLDTQVRQWHDPGAHVTL
jgi:MurNAc alpha-1-phosphate uridylyltransferase